MKKTKSMVMGAAILAALALPMVAGAANKLVVRNAADTADAAVVTDTGYIGIGTNAPAGPIHIVANGTSIQSGGFTLQFTANGAGVANKYFYAPNFSLMRNNDLTENSGYPRLDDALGYFNFGTTTPATGVVLNRALLYAKAEKAWNGTDQPSYFQLLTNPGGGLANREVLRLSSSGVATVNGGLRLYPYTGVGSAPIGTGTNPPAKPTCDATTQGMLWFTKNATAKDSLELCANSDATGTNYGWRPIY